MDTTKEELKIRRYFRISIVIKGVISLVEVVAGTLALFVPLTVVSDLVARMTEGELAEDPGDFIATHLVQLAHQFAFAGSTFIAIYLLTRGLIKVGLIAAMLKGWLWAYPSSLLVLGLFVLYQLYQIYMTHSILILLLTLFDLVVIYFIWKEYAIVRGQVQIPSA